MRCLPFALLAAAAAISAQGVAPIILGVLEDVPGVYDGEPPSPGVRVAFRKKGSDWEALPNDCGESSCLKAVASTYPREIGWTIAFDGKRLGHVTGRTPEEFDFYAHIGLQKVISALPVPTVGKRSAENEGDIGGAVYRPLVAVSQPFFNDPESWKPAQLPAELIGILRQNFRQRFPKLCKSSPRDESKLVRFAYRDEDVRLVKAYTSKRQWGIARLSLKGAIDCNDLEADFGIDDPWFVIDPQRLVRYFGSGMWLVDAGDYDNDGKAELVFSIGRYNRGGYVLFYDDFKKSATFEYRYH
jgi:hypothetical protein